MKRLFYLLLFISVFLFYWNTDIVNRTEADDTFEYSLMVETENHPWIYHPHHLLYGISMQRMYGVMKVLGYDGGAFQFLVFMSSLSAAGAVFLFYKFCYRRYSMRPVSSLFAAGLLALSYGFWRYACEAEVILPAGFLVLLAVYLATAVKSNWRQVAGAAFVSGISVLFHILNGVPVFAAIPLFYLLNKRLGHAVLHVGIAGIMVLIVYLLIFNFKPDLLFVDALPGAGQVFGVSNFLRGTIGFGQCIASGNFIFGFDEVAAKLLQLFPSRMLAEEVYMGQHMSLYQRIVPILTLLLFCSSVGYGILRAVIGWIRAFRLERTDAMLMVGGWQTVAIIAIWLAFYALAILCLEPGNPEVWVLGLIPFWLLVCGLIISPIAHANELWVVLVILLSLGLHNFFGGIGILQNEGADYNVQKAAWVLEQAKESDLILTAGNPVFLRYLNYHARTGVLDLNSTDEGELQGRIENAHAVYVFNDVFEYLPSMKIRFPHSARKVDAFASELRPLAIKVADDEFGGVWKLTCHDAPTD